MNFYLSTSTTSTAPPIHLLIPHLFFPMLFPIPSFFFLSTRYHQRGAQAADTHTNQINQSITQRRKNSTSAGVHTESLFLLFVIFEV